MTRRNGRPFRPLLIAEAANPEWASVPLVGWSHAAAVASITDAHLVTQVRNLDADLRAGFPPGRLTAIDSEAVAAPAHRLAALLRGGAGKGWTTVSAFEALSYPYFERQVWRRFGPRIAAGEFDLVHRITPLSPASPSPIAARCAALGVPFVVGPLNGGVPWPRGFDRARRREKEWLSYVRGVYRLLPWYRATRRHASAIVIGSIDTWRQMPACYHPRCVYNPENAVDIGRFSRVQTRPPPLPLRVVFVGRLVPYKGADMLLEAAAPLVRGGAVVVDIVGDGPEMPRLTSIVEREGIASGVEFAGWVPQDRIQDRFGRAHVMGFPSIREFGGAVALEAMALGVVPIIVGYAGPAELVTPSTGFTVPIGRREEIVRGFREVLGRLAADPSPLPDMIRRGRERVRRLYTWEAKARQMIEVYRWVLGERPDKPDWGMPFHELPDEPAPAAPRVGRRVA